MDAFAERLEAAQAGTHAVVDLDRYATNVQAMRAHIGERVQLMAVVKANAYGHGIIPCARAAIEAGATWLAVARVEEGLHLRAKGIAAPVLVIGPPNPRLLRRGIEQGIALAAGTSEILDQIADAAAAAGRRAAIHLKVETGLHRYGIERGWVAMLAQRVLDDPNLDLEGIYTHFATADELEDGFLDVQVGRFEETWRELRLAGARLPFVHAANSAAALRRVIPHLEETSTPVVRAGYALFGLSPSGEVPVTQEFRPILTLKSHVARVFTLPEGEGVSYGRTFMAERPVCCATLPVGYGDGLFRMLSNQGWALVRGVRCPIRGRVAMDQTVIEVEGVPNVAIGDEAILIGEDDGSMTVDDIARLCGTIGYEIVTALSERLPRVFIRHGRPVAVSDLRGLVEFEPAS